MAAFSIDVDKARLHGRALPIITIVGTKGPIKWVYLRSFAAALFPGAVDTSSTTFALQELGLDASVVLHTRAEHPGIEDNDWTALKRAYMAHVADALTVCQPRRLSLLPLKTAVRVARARGSLPFLRALNFDVPDPVVDETIKRIQDKRCDKAEDDALRSLASEMAQYDRIPDDEDNAGATASAGRKRVAIKVGKRMQKWVDNYRVYRLSRINTKRDGGSVAEATVDGEIKICCRFLGWLRDREIKAKQERRHYTMRVFQDQDIAKHAETYLDELKAKNRAWSTLANYSNGLYTILLYVERNMDASSPAALALYRLRQQTEKEARVDQIWAEKKPNWIDWNTAQECRRLAFQQLKAYRGNEPRRKAMLLRRALIVGLLTLLPPDRVAVHRKLCIDTTLVEDGLDFAIDMRKTRTGFKTSKHTGPTYTKLPSVLTPLIVEFIPLRRALMPGVPKEADMPAYLFQSGRKVPKLIPAANWSLLVGSSFRSLCGVAATGNILRSSFVTHLRSQPAEQLPASLLESCAWGLRHSVQTDASSRYDKERHNRINKEAHEYTAGFAERWDATHAGGIDGGDQRKLTSVMQTEGRMAARRAKKARASAPADIAGPPEGMPIFDGPWKDECLVCDDGGKLLCCSYCHFTAHDTEECRGPVPASRSDWFCIVCERKFKTGTAEMPGDDDDDEDEHTPIIDTTKVPEQGHFAIVKLDADECGMPWCVAECLERPETIGDACAVQYYTSVCEPVMRLNLEGTWHEEWVRNEKTRQSTRVRGDVVLADCGILWGPFDALFVAGASCGSRGTPPVKSSVLERIGDHAGVDWRRKHRPGQSMGCGGSSGGSGGGIGRGDDSVGSGNIGGGGADRADSDIASICRSADAEGDSETGGKGRGKRPMTKTALDPDGKRARV
jgi:hypothetical protein